MTIVLMIMASVFLVVCFDLFLKRQSVEKFKKITFKVGTLSDNLGNNYYIIVGQAKDGSYQELKDFPVVRANLISKRVANYVNSSWQNLDEAEKELNYFRIAIGQVKYEKKISINEKESR